MTTLTSDRFGTLVVRAWIEVSAETGFRARVMHSTDSGTRGESTSTAGTPEDLYAIVRTWVETFLQPN